MASKTNLSLAARPRETLGRQLKKTREQGLLPAVIYGYKTKNIPLFLDSNEFYEVFRQAGETSLITLEIKGGAAKTPVLIHDFQRDPVSGEIIHVDFYKPNLEKKVEASVPLKIEGVAPAVKNLGGTIVKHFSEIEVRALPTNLPHEIVVNIDDLTELGSEILVKDLKIPEGAEVMHQPDEVLVTVVAPEKVEEELEKPLEEKIEEVEKVDERKEEQEAEPETKASKEQEKK